MFENITPPGVALTTLHGQTIYGTQAVLVNPKDTTNVYVGVDHQGIYKSTDCGATWAKVNKGRNGSTLDTGTTWSMVIDPVNPEVIYSVNGYGSEQGLWKTTNGGADWDQLFPAGSQVAQTVQYDFASIVSMDPGDHMHLVVSFHAACTGAFAPNCQAETKDAGATWRLFKGPAVNNWEGAGPMVLSSTSWLYALPFDGLWLTTDSGATWKQVTPQGATGSSYELYHSKRGNYYVASLQGVLKSSDGLSWALIPNSGGLLTGIVGTGKNLYGSQQYGTSFFAASEAMPQTWTMLPTPGKSTPNRGAYLLAYDSDHGILYATAQEGGLWRAVVP